MPERKRILIFSLTYFPFVGGAEVAVKEISDRLPEFDFEMLTVNLDGKQKTEERIGNVKIYRIGRGKISKYFFPFTAYKFAKTLQQKNNYQIIWAMMANQAGLAALFFKLKFPQIKYLLTLQEGDSERDIWLRTWFIRPLYKMIYRRADFIQVISNHLARRAVKIGYKGKIEVVPNGVDFKQLTFNNKPEERKEKIVITTSRLVKKNGIEYLIRAMSQANAKLLIAGGGNLEGKLKNLTQEFGLSEKIHFLGHLEPDKIFSYLNKADVFVRPSLSEGLGNAFLEAMAMGVPVIGTPVGGIPDFLKDGETGWFCEGKNPKSIAEKINFVLDSKNKELVARVAENARKMVAQNYNWRNIAQKMKEIFQELL